jgi:hypothetical protein
VKGNSNRKAATHASAPTAKADRDMGHLFSMIAGSPPGAGPTIFPISGKWR